MPILKAKNSKDKYRLIAQHFIHKNELTGRGQNIRLTRLRWKYIQKNINSLNKKLSKFLDVGCGDGSFLIFSQKIFQYSIGILPTKIEVKVVKKLINKQIKNNFINIKQGLTNNLPENDQSIDFLLCNSVLHGVGFNSKSVDKSLREFKRVLKKNCFLYIGEIPEINELEERKDNNSLLSHLFYNLFKRGPKYFLINLKKIIISIYSNNYYILQRSNMFFEKKNFFCHRLEKMGFKVLKVFDSNTNKIVKNNSFSPKRTLDYLCKSI